MIVNTILSGNNLETLKTLPDNFINCCVTSPPYYGLRDYGTAQWEGGDPNCDHKIPAIEYDKLRSNNEFDASHIMRFNRKNCYKCGATRIDQQIGLEETAEEYIERLVGVFREVRRVLCDNGTLWLNIGDSYNNYKGNAFSDNAGSNYAGFRNQPTRKSGYGLECKNLKPKDLMGIPWALAFALRTDGWWLRQDIIWHKPNPMPESVKDRCTKAHEYIFLLSKSNRYYFNSDAIKETATSFGKPRPFAKTGNKDRNDVGNIFTDTGYRQKRDVWTVNTSPNTYAHFATYPEELIIPCILAGCPENGIVLDPFIGAGTTAVVALKLLRKYIGCEINTEYIKIAEQRITNERGLFNE
jgi:DNA modification methylase